MFSIYVVSVYKDVKTQLRNAHADMTVCARPAGKNTAAFVFDAAVQQISQTLGQVRCEGICRSFHRTCSVLVRVYCADTRFYVLTNDLFFQPCAYKDTRGLDELKYFYGDHLRISSIQDSLLRRSFNKSGNIV